MSSSDLADTPSAWVNGHPDEGLLHEGLDDLLGAAESALVAEHVSRCALCRTRVAEAHGFISATRRIFKKVKVEPGEVPTETAAAESAPQPLTPVTAQAQEAPAAEPVTAAAEPVEIAGLVASAPVEFVAPAASAKAAAPAARPAIQPAAPARPGSAPQPPRKRSKPFPWMRVGQIAALLAVVAGAPPLYRAIRDRPLAAPAPEKTVPVPEKAAPAPPPVVLKEPGAPAVAVEPGAETLSQPAVAAYPDKRTRLGPPAPSPAVAVLFDSLTVTRTVCIGQCDEFELHINSAGEVRFVERARFGEPRAVSANAAGPALKRMSAVVSRALFETRAVPLAGRSMCTVFDNAHVPTMRLMVARGASRALHAGNCGISAGELLKLGAEIDSLAGADKLKSALTRTTSH